MIDCSYIKEIVVSVKDIFMKPVTDKEIHFKGIANIVTDSDIKVQELVIKKLNEKYPNVEIIAEESKQDKVVDKNKAYFIIDPIDGTTNFKYGLNHSAISLAYLESGKVLYGIIYNPYTKEIFEGFSGKGAFLNGKRIYANKAKSLQESIVAFGTCPYKKEYAKEIFDTIYRIFMKSLEVRRFGSAALDMCYVACGRFDAYLEKELRIWDISAGYVIAQEAGAKVVKYSGEEFDTMEHSGIIVANEDLLKEILGNIPTTFIEKK